jgi:hypothetical protein
MTSNAEMNLTPPMTIPLETEEPKPADSQQTEIRVHGKTLQVPAIRINGATVIVKGKWLKLAVVKDEDLVEPVTFDQPEVFIKGLKQSGAKPDLFTFAQKVPETTPKFQYHLEWDNAAMVPITTLKDWLEKRVEYDVRKAIKKAAKLGVTARSVEFDDTLVQGIVDIYGESPTRQGKAFWHYRKDFETVKHESGTYLEKSEFIGAYFENVLIGFIKMAYVGKIASTIHVISMKKHFDKKVTNLLLAKAVEICEQKGATHLVYGNYIYSDPTSSLTEFKRRNGFEKAMIPRYYVPLTVKGRLALRLGLHHGLGGMLPEPAKNLLRKARARIHSRATGPTTKETKPQGETAAKNRSEG